MQPANDGTADIIFGATPRLTPDLTLPWNVNSVTFNNTAGAYNLFSTLGNTLSIESSINVDGAVTGVQTINLANTAMGSLLMSRGGGLVITNNSAAVGTTLRIGPNTVISPSTADINFPDLYVAGVGTTEISGSYVSKNCCGSTSGNVPSPAPAR